MNKILVLIPAISLFNISVNAQENNWGISFGYTVYNEFLYGSQTTSSAVYLRQGYKVNPSFLLSHRLGQSYSLNLKYENGFYFSKNPYSNGYFIENIKDALQIELTRDFNLHFIGIGFTFVTHKYWNYFHPFGLDRTISDHFGPSLSYGHYFNNGYRLSVGYDMIWDFGEQEFFFFSDFVNLRLHKDLFHQSESTALSKYDIAIAVGLEVAYNHNKRYSEFFPSLQKHLFAELEFFLTPQWAIFLKRSLWVDIGVTRFTSQSDYIQTNNFGIKYSTNELNNRFAVSHYISNESFYDKLTFANDSMLGNRIFEYQGVSLSYEHRLFSNYFLSSQVDLIIGSRVFEKPYERIRPRLGLKYLF